MSFCRTTVHINTEPVHQPTLKCFDLCGAETRGFVCSRVSAHLQASTTSDRITIMQSQLQFLQIMTDCKVNVFGAFPSTEKRTNTTSDVFNVCFDMHMNGNDDDICINSVKAFLRREELGFFNGLCSIKLTTSISWKVFYGEICSLAQQSTYR